MICLWTNYDICGKINKKINRNLKKYWIIILLIVLSGLIINAKIKTQCTIQNVLEPVGSPAVLYYVG